MRFDRILWLIQIVNYELKPINVNFGGSFVARSYLTREMPITRSARIFQQIWNRSEHIFFNNVFVFQAGLELKEGLGSGAPWPYPYPYPYDPSMGPYAFNG